MGERLRSVFEPEKGANITVAAVRAVDIANALDETIQLRFNDTEVPVRPGDDPEVVIRAWMTLREDSR